VTKSSSKPCPADTADTLIHANLELTMPKKIDLEAISKLLEDLKFNRRVPQVVKQISWHKSGLLRNRTIAYARNCSDYGSNSERQSGRNMLREF
jgi:hypothetical protein